MIGNVSSVEADQRHADEVPILFVLNGPPAAGKSTLARRYCDDHPLTFALDMDVIRDLLGRWRAQPVEAGIAARAIAVVGAGVHLAAGYDVVVPQLVANPAFLDELAAAATNVNASFVEFFLSVERNQSLQRYSHRWRAGDDPVHRTAEPPDLEDIGRLYDRLATVAAKRRDATTLPSGSPDEVYNALLDALKDRPR